MKDSCNLSNDRYTFFKGIIHLYMNKILLKVRWHRSMRIIKQANGYNLDISHEEWLKIGETNKWLNVNSQFNPNSENNSFNENILRNSPPDYLLITPTPQQFMVFYHEKIEGDLEKEENLEEAAHQHIENVISGILGGKNILSPQQVNNIISAGLFMVNIESNEVYLLGNKSVNKILTSADLEIISRSLDNFALELENTQDDDIINII